TTAPSTEGFSKPGYVVSEPAWISVKGDASADSITQASVFKLNYEISETATFEITVPEGALVSNATPSYNEVVTVESNDPEFVAWMDGDQVISYSPVYKFSALSDRELTIATEGSEQPAVSLQVLELRAEHNSYLGQVYLPTGASLVEWGLLLSDSNSFPTYGDEGVTALKSNSINPATNEFLRSIPFASTTEYVRAYAVVKVGT